MSLDTAAAVSGLRGLTSKFDNAVRSTPVFYPTLCSVVPSRGADEEYGLLGRVPGVREWLGERNFKTLRAAKWTLENKSWETSVLIDRDDIDDDRLGMYAITLAQMGARAAKHPDKLLFSLINDGESSEAFDGQYFFDTDHSWGDSGTQDNDLSASAVSPTAPTAAELKVAYNAALVALTGYKDDQGELLNSDIVDEAQSLVIMTPPGQMHQAAHDALTVRLGSQGGDNVVIMRPRIYASARLTGTAKFDVYKVDEPLKPYIFQARKPLQRQMKGRNDIEEKGVKFMTEARYNLGYGAWWCAVRTTFS